MIDALTALLVFALLAACGSVAWQTIRIGISPMPSSHAARQAVIELAALVEPKALVYELGAGWGTLAFALARAFPAAQIHAWEASWVPYLFCRARKALSRSKNLALHRGDFFTTSLGDASLVTCYLFTGAMARLRPKFETELRQGCVVVSNTFGVRGWTPEKVVTLDDVYRTPVYRYRAQHGTASSS